MPLFHELRELISVETPLGHGYAMFVESGEHDTFWTVALDNCAVVTFAQSEIRMSRNYTHRRGISHREMKKIIKGPKKVVPRLHGTPNSMRRMLRTVQPSKG